MSHDGILTRWPTPKWIVACRHLLRNGWDRCPKCDRSLPAESWLAAMEWEAAQFDASLERHLVMTALGLPTVDDGWTPAEWAEWLRTGDPWESAWPMCESHVGSSANDGIRE